MNLRKISVMRADPQRRRTLIRSRDKENKQAAAVVCFFHAVIALKRLVRMRRKYWKKTSATRMRTSKSAFRKEIHKSHRSVKYAAFGREVVTLSGGRIEQHRADELDKAVEVKLKKQVRMEKLSRRRGGGTNMKDVTANLMANLHQLSTGDSSIPIGRQEQKASVADRIRAMKTSFPVDLSHRDANAKKSKLSGGMKETTSKEVTHILQKNAHIAVTQMKRNEPNRTNKIRNNLKIMKKMNIQEVLNYASGTAVYFGATVAFQSRHGGFLSYNKLADIKASAPKILPNARFVVWNCDDLNDHGIMRYGDAVWLQAGVHEVLGAQFGGGAIGADGTRKLKPSLINCRRENSFKAQQYGRWIVLNRENPSDSLGDQVLHHDKIMLEQEWCFLASHTPYDSFMEKSHSFQDAETKGGERPDFFKPIEECIWRLHLVTLPSDDNADARFREYLLDQAKEQIKYSAQDRHLKERILSGPLSRRISDSLKPEEVIKRHLPQASSKEATQLHLLKKFDKQKMRDFSKTRSNVSVLKHIYGPQSIIYKNARNAESALREKSRHATDSRIAELQKDEEDAGPKLSLEETEDLYWDLATNVLADTRAWEGLPASMEVYEDFDQSKKEVAVRVLQRFARNKLANMFSWKRVMNSIDLKETSRLSNSLLYQATQPVKKPAVMEEEDEDGDAGHNDKTFLTSSSNENGEASGVANTTRRVSKAHIGEVTPELNRLQQVMHVETLEDEEEEKHVSRKHFLKVSLDYFQGSVTSSRPRTAPVLLLHQDGEIETQDMKRMSRHDRKNLMSSASASSMHAVNAARLLLRGSSDQSLTIKERPKSAENELVFTDIEKVVDRTADVNGTNDNNDDNDNDHEQLKPKRSKDPSSSSHRILGKFEPKTQNKKEHFNKIIRSLSQSQDPNCGLPKDVFQDPHQHISVSTSLSFLRASSSTPHIYSDIKTTRCKDKYKPKKMKRK